MTSEVGAVVTDDFIFKVLRDDIYRVCNAVADSSQYATCPYGSHKPHDDLLIACKGCKRDTTELQRAMKARDDAELYLKHVTCMETTYLRKAVDTYKIRPKEEDLT